MSASAESPAASQRRAADPRPLRRRHGHASGFLWRCAGPFDRGRANSCANFRRMSAPATAPASLKRTPLYDLHRELGAKMVDFGGWEMPVQYAGILEEHQAVRERVGLFDVSHMGEIDVAGARRSRASSSG